jgi:hypothetical protein
MDYFNRNNDEEMGGISYCSCDLNPTGITANRIKFGDVTMDIGDLRVDKYDKIIKELSDKVEVIMKHCSFKQEKKISEWREFDLEAATGREFETR